MLRVIMLINCDGENALPATCDSIEAQDIAEVRMGTLIERTEEPDQCLNGQEASLPGGGFD